MCMEDIQAPFLTSKAPSILRMMAQIYMHFKASVGRLTNTLTGSLSVDCRDTHASHKQTGLFIYIMYHGCCNIS